MRCPKCQSDNTEDSRFCNKCGTHLFSKANPDFPQTATLQTPVETLIMGATLADRYKIIEELGMGGMGRVYKVHDKAIHEIVALKVLKHEIAADETIIDRFRNELKLSRKISHKNVCRMYDISQSDSRFFITMEYVSGEDLKHTIRKVGHLSLDKVISLVIQTCEGLAEAHRLGVIHRDLKPHNLMIDGNGDVRIMDFGIARSIKAQGFTTTGMMVGTPEYMSPEQARGEEIDARSDIYSLGIVFYELLTGEVPFTGDSAVSIALKHTTDLPRHPQEINPQIPNELIPLVFRCLKKDRNDRYPSVQALLSDLNTVRRSLTATAGVARRRRTRIKTEKRRFPLPRLWLALLLGAIIATGAYLLIKKPLHPFKKAASELAEKTPLSVPTPSPETVTKAENMPESAGLTPATMAIDSQPQGAEIFLDNRFVGITPLRTERPPGNCRIRLKKEPEYKDFSADINLTEGATFNRTYRLTPFYRLSITSDPLGADVFVNGIAQGETPVSLEVPDGTCRLRLSKQGGWSPIEEAVTLKPGVTSLSFTLRKSAARLSIETDPAEAIIRLDNREIGTTPLFHSVSLGIHSITISKPGYRTLEETISVLQDLQKTYLLQKLGVGTIRITALPYAFVSIDGDAAGEVPPPIDQSINEGQHTLEFVSPTLNKRHRLQIEIRPGASIEVRMNMETGKSRILNIE